MKCKTCGNDLQAGVRICPYCGSSTATSRTSRGEFKWNVQDFHKPQKNGDFSVDWESGKLMDKNSQKIFDRDSNEWSTPKEEEVFAFAEMEKTQPDKEIESENSHKNAPIFDFSSVSGREDFKPVGTTGEAAKRTLNLSDDFLSWGNEENKKPAVYNSFIDDDENTDEEKAVPNRPKPYTADWNFEDESEEPEDESFLFKKFDPGDISEIHNKADSIKSETAERDELSVLEEFKKLINDERSKTKEEEDFSYMSDDEVIEADAAMTRAENLKASPKFSFASLENEYYRYCEDNGIEPAKNKFGNKEVEIKINEPSGTKVTVKTQEINLLKSGSDDDVKTKEVELDNLRRGPKNVQVSVEVNAAAGNASVEVTRQHDGATIVKTLDEGSDKEHVYVGGTNPQDNPNNVGGEAYKDEKFWNHPLDSASRMTITDIFGPEARKIIGKLDKAKKGSRDTRGTLQKDLDNSLMLDIRPEDIALSAEQTKELMLMASEDLIDEIPDFESDTDDTEVEKDIEAADDTIEEKIEESQEESDITAGDADSEDSEKEIEEKESVADDTGNSEDAGDVDADTDFGDEFESETQAEESEETDEEVEEGTEEAEPQTEESEEAGESYSEDKEQGDSTAEENTEAGDLDSESDIEGSTGDADAVSETDEIIDDAEGQTEPDTNSGENQIRYTQEKRVSSGFTKSVKTIIFILAILLLMEFTVIGIKLFASGSQADVFITRVQDQVVGIFDKDES